MFKTKPTASVMETVGGKGSAIAKKPSVNLFAAFENAKGHGNLSAYDPTLFKSMKNVREEKKAANFAVRSASAKKAAATRRARTNALKAAGGAGIPEENARGSSNIDSRVDGLITLIQSWATTKDGGYIGRLLTQLTKNRASLDAYVTAEQRALLRDDVFFAALIARLQGPAF
jgi:hypothetical protein